MRMLEFLQLPTPIPATSGPSTAVVQDEQIRGAIDADVANAEPEGPPELLPSQIPMALAAGLPIPGPAVKAIDSGEARQTQEPRRLPATSKVTKLQAAPPVAIQTQAAAAPAALPPMAVDVIQAAQLLQVHPETIRREIRLGNLKAFRIGRGRSWRIRTHELQAYLKRLEAEAAKQVAS